MSNADVMARLTEIESQIRELKSMQDLMLRLLSAKRPLASLLDYYGATESKEQAVFHLLDELVERIRGPQHREPTFSLFKVRLGGIFPELREDREFVQLVIDTLKVERPAYQELHSYMVKHHWPVWD
jgi:hypothetical protein